jgi:hypothetical protein
MPALTSYRERWVLLQEPYLRKLCWSSLEGKVSIRTEVSRKSSKKLRITLTSCLSSFVSSLSLVSFPLYQLNSGPMIRWFGYHRHPRDDDVALLLSAQKRNIIITSPFEGGNCRVNILSLLSLEWTRRLDCITTFCVSSSTEDTSFDGNQDRKDVLLHSYLSFLCSDVNIMMLLSLESHFSFSFLISDSWNECHCGDCRLSCTSGQSIQSKNNKSPSLCSKEGRKKRKVVYPLDFISLLSLREEV